MSATELQLRTSAFGGFQKQDVLSYIETTNRAHAEQAEALKRELDEAARAKAAAEERAAAASARQAELEGQVEELTGELERRSCALEEARAALEACTARAEALEAEGKRWKARLERAEPLAEAYESVKDRTAGIELEAHHRALTVQADAEAQVKKLRAELEQWLYKVQAGYDRLRTDVDATISHASGELDRVRRSLGDISAEFAEHDAALEALLDTCRETIGPKAPEPLPLDGEG